MNKMGFTSLLQLLFIALKLCAVVNWSWVWVLAPLWISFIAGAALFLFCIAMAILTDQIK